MFHCHTGDMSIHLCLVGSLSIHQGWKHSNWLHEQWHLLNSNLFSHHIYHICWNMTCITTLLYCYSMLYSLQLHLIFWCKEMHAGHLHIDIIFLIIIISVLIKPCHKNAAVAVLCMACVTRFNQRWRMYLLSHSLTQFQLSLWSTKRRSCTWLCTCIVYTYIYIYSQSSP